MNVEVAEVAEVVEADVCIVPYELPPRLLDALTLFIGSSCYVQIGYEPFIAAEEDIDIAFALKCVLVVDNRFFLLLEDELTDLYELLNSFNTARAAASRGSFTVRASTMPGDLGDHVVVQKGYEEIAFPPALFAAIMDLFPIIENYMLERRVFREHFEGELYKAFDDAAKRCRNDGPFIRYAVRSTSEKLFVEIACNFLSIFIQFCEIRRRR